MSSPETVAIVMDGNRRWAKKNNLPYASGHRKGIETLIDIVSIFGDTSLLDGLLGCAELIPTLESGILSAFLPFDIPLIGTGEGWTGVGILPVLMGVTLFLTMKKTMATAENQNKALLYGMNGMFVLLFNSFPAGLNLYYVFYNLLNYLHQRDSSKNLSSLKSILGSKLKIAK